MCLIGLTSVGGALVSYLTITCPKYNIYGFEDQILPYEEEVN